MSQLSLTKNYGDLTLLFKADIDGMWDELENKTNGNIDSDNVNSGWATWGQVTLDKDTDYSVGATESGMIRYYSSTNTFVFAHDTTARDTIFKIGGTEVARIQETADFESKQDVYFYNRSTTYPLSWLLQYQKPVLVYSDSSTINVEQNTATANRTLIVFPAGPIEVTENVSTTHKFRSLKTTATANGYDAGHTGAADSGLRDGLSLTSNTWYFVYAVVVRYGDDAGNNFILVADTTSPHPTNWGTLDTRFGAGYWVYLGLFRRGYGTTATTTIIPFIQDHQGWHTFTGRASTNFFFGVCVNDQDAITSATSYDAIASFSSADIPNTCSLARITLKVETDFDGDMTGHLAVLDSGGSRLFNLLSYGNNLSSSEDHGMEVIIPATEGITISAKKGSGSDDDHDVSGFIAAVLDEWA